MVYGLYAEAGFDWQHHSHRGYLDTLVAFTAGMALFPIVFAGGLEPSGPGLMFVTLPVAFGNIAFGQVMGTLFFVWC